MFSLYANKNKLILREKELTTSGSANVYDVKFEFSDDWDGLTKTAVFKLGKNSESVLLDDDVPQCTIPTEIMVDFDRPLMIGVYGTLDETTVLPTIWANAGTVREGTELPDETPGEGGGGISEEQLAELEAKIAKKGDTLEYDGLDLKLLSDGKEISSVPMIGGGGGNLPEVTGVLAFNGRQGSVKPQAGDYTAEMVGALPDTFQETDPTVSEWAKQPEKPAYTAEEVGADPAGTAEKIKDEIEASLASKLDKTGGVVTGAIRFEEAGDISTLAEVDDGLVEPLGVPKQVVAVSSAGLHSTGDLKVQTGSGVVEFSTLGKNADVLTVLSGVEADPDDEFSVPNVQQTRDLVSETVQSATSQVEGKIPTKVSQLNNDAGFITGAEADSKISNALSGIEGGEGIVGPQGEPGRPGAVYTPSVSEHGVLSWTNNGDLQNPTPVNIMGPAGQPGENGKNGENGQNGVDGFSPTVSVTKIDDGHEVTITDANGSQSFDVIDGQDGPKGDPGDTPYIGENGHWWIGEEDTGTPAEGSSIEGDIPVKALTTTEYNALSDEQKNSDVAWLVTDANTSSGNTGGESVENIYSLEEQRIGTWIDGKSLYRKCFIFTLSAQPLQSNTIKGLNLSSINVDNVVRCDGFVNLDGIHYAVNNNNNGNENNAQGTKLYITIWNKTVEEYHGTNLNNAQLNLILEYTKTTD